MPVSGKEKEIEEKLEGVGWSVKSETEMMARRAGVGGEKRKCSVCQRGTVRLIGAPLLAGQTLPHTHTHTHIKTHTRRHTNTGS